MNDQPPPVHLKVIPHLNTPNVRLFIHQRANIYQMEELERTNTRSINISDANVLKTTMGILGDKPGTGKTLMVLGLIFRDKMKWDEGIHPYERYTHTNFNSSICLINRENYVHIKTNLIVTPSSIIKQWYSEIAKLGISCKIVKSKHDVRDLEDFDIVLCTRSMYNHLASVYEKYRFKRFVFDEVDSAIITSMQPINAGFTWLITATFHEIHASVKKLRNHFLKSIFSIFNSNETDHLYDIMCIKSIDKLIEMTPIPSAYKTIFYIFPEVPVIRHMADLINPDIVEMIEAGNIRDAIHLLGGSEDDSNVADAIRSQAVKKLQGVNHMLADPNITNERRATLLIQKEECTRRVNKIEERIANIQLDECIICNEPLENPVLFDCCQTLICGNCTVTGFSLNRDRRCMQCNSSSFKIVHLTGFKNEAKEEQVEELDEEKKIEELDEEKEEKINDMTSLIRSDNKLKNILRILKTAKKLVIFLSYSDNQKNIMDHLKNHNIPSSCLSGHISTRERILNDFKTGDLRVLILNSRENGAGLNLQVATDLIIWNKMPDNLVVQSIGRALRYGLDHTITVHKFYPQN